MTKAVAITIMAILAACGQPGAAQPGAAIVSAERATSTIGETNATLTSDEREELLREAYLGWLSDLACRASDRDTVSVPGIGLVPAHEANTYLVQPGCDD